MLLITCGREAATPRSRLIETYTSLPHRPIELRLAGFPFVTRGSVSRGEEEESLSLKGAAYAVLTAASTSGDVRLRAVARAFVSDWRQAGAELEKVAENSADWTVWNDLAAIRFELARRGLEPRALGKALAAADRAIELAPATVEPRFNRAAILEAMQLGRLAANAWNDAAAREPNTPWANEARSRGGAGNPSRSQEWQQIEPTLYAAAGAGQVGLVDPVVRRFAREVRTTGEGPLLATWGELYLAGRPDEARRQLRIIRFLGERLVALGGDPLLRDAAIAIENADRSGRAGDLARAHRQYKQARLLIHNRQPGAAEKVMADAERQFRAGASPMELVARSYRVGIVFDRNRLVDAATLLDSISDQLTPEWKALRAQVEWDRSRIASRRGDIYQVSRHAEAAAQLYEELREHDYAIQMQSSLATVFTSLGRADDAWGIRLRTFAGATASGNPNLLEHVLHAAAKEEILESRFDVAAAFFRLMLNERPASAVRRFEGVLWQTFLASRLGGHHQPDGLDQAVRAIEDDELRSVAQAQRDFAEALLLEASRPEAAIELLARSIQSNEARSIIEGLPEAYLARGRMLRRLGQLDRASEDLDRALTIVEERRQRVEPLALRDSFFGTTESTCDALIDLHVERRNYAEAFHVAERCRARSLVDVAAGPRQQPVTADAATRRIPSGTALVHYTALRDRLFVCVLRREGFTTHIVPTGKSALAGLSATLRSAMERRDEEAADPVLRALYNALIAPVAREIAGRVLIVSPDQVLAEVPFAALRGESGRYLIEDAPVTIAPSVTLHLAGGGHHATQRRHALIVGDPAFDAAQHDLTRLPQAAAEARELAGLYGGATILTDRAATPDRFLSEVDRADIIHIAAHAVISPRDANLSTLLFAPTSSGNGLLYQSRIAELRLTHEPLVILAGCRTASAAGGRGSIRSLALAFLAAGSRAVVGSLWNVEDGVTRRFSRALHGNLRHQSPAAALRGAQLEMLRSPDANLRDPAAWGAFEIHAAEESE